jgi:signal transduction histidine kinase
VELSNARREGRATDERFHLRKDGSRFYCSGVTTRLGGSTTLGFAKIARDMTHQLEAQRELQQAHAGLEERVAQRTRELQAEVERRTAAQAHATNLLRKLVTAQEDQRASIARDLHDQLGQQLTALRLTLERHRDDVARTGENSDDLERAMALTQQIDKDLDFLAWELRPAVLDDLGLMAALPRFVRDWSEHYGITAEFRSAGFTAGQLSREVEVTFYRVAQEALNNVVKHAHASRVDVILESRDGTVVLVVEDDGVGFEPAHADSAHGIGLVGMRERAALSGANLEIESAPGDGTTIFLRSPVQPSNAPPESK